MDTDKAYLLGLIIGGGHFGNAEDIFKIRLPYKKWGSYIENPSRATKIIDDILHKVGSMFKVIYSIGIQYETTKGGTWDILCEGDITPIKIDLAKYGIACEGEIRSNVDISKIIIDLVDDNLKRRFIAGLADTIGSMAKSQRRFDDNHQILSFEINGYNFKFVCDLCKLLYSINCIPNQVNWNHPNINCSNNSYYKEWNKGFKLRILLDQYDKFGAFAFRSKAESSKENRKLQHKTNKAELCEECKINAKPSCVHPAENDSRLPEPIRGGHYINFRHFCAVLGCEHAPYKKLCSCFEHIGDLINPFPILCKDIESRIQEIIKNDVLFSTRKYSNLKIKVSSLLNEYEKDNTFLLYGTKKNNGYPIAEILQATAYAIAKTEELKGTRPKGNYTDLIKKHLAEDSDLTITIKKPDLLTPLVIIGNGRGALIGAKNPDVYKKLISFASDNRFKVIVRPITEEDLRND